MLFNSFEFALFFPIVTLLFFALPHKFRWQLLLLASCFFYMFFKPIYILILFFTILIDYFAGIYIANAEDIKTKKRYLIISIAANVGVLVIFKYFNFFAVNTNELFKSININFDIPLLNILLPIGLSFHTFQAMSYTIEVYRGNQTPERHLGIYALYVMFYPQLVAGPIERPQNVLHQFYEKKVFDYDNFRGGLILIAWGLFKKVVIADRLALFVNSVYNDPYSFKGIPILTSTCFFALQIFCDFSGYSDIAIGSAKCMGFDLTLNFNRPYYAKSISEFWKRWHISLSTWFRDYLYIPLGGNRLSRSRLYLNLLIVFALSGVWHGANWTFIIWGLLNGIYLIIESIITNRTSFSFNNNSFIVSTLKRVLVFNLICLSWIFFRAQDLTQALYLLKNSTALIPEQIENIITNKLNNRLHILYLDQGSFQFFLSLILIAFITTIHYLQKEERFDIWLMKKSKSTRWIFYYFLVITFITLGVFGKSEFIYFQF